MSNKATVAMFEGPRKEDILDRLSYVITPQAFAGMQDQLVRLVQGQGNVEVESLFRTLSGRMIQVAINVAAASGNEREPQRLLVSVQDITQRQEAAEALEQEQRRLRQLLEVYEQHRRLIAYDIHDAVCQPLAAALMTFESCTHRLQRECAERTRAGFSHVLQLLQEGLRESRRLMSGLRPPILDESGLLAALEYLVCENQGVDGLEIHFSHAGQFGRWLRPWRPPSSASCRRGSPTPSVIAKASACGSVWSKSTADSRGNRRLGPRLRPRSSSPRTTSGWSACANARNCSAGRWRSTASRTAAPRIRAELPVVAGDFRRPEGEA